MKKIISIAWVLGLISGTALGSEVATVSGMPDTRLDFVKALLEKQISLLPNDVQVEQELTTAAFSIFSQHQVSSATAISVLRVTGIASLQDWMDGLRLGAENAPIVFTNLGPVLSPICELMLQHPQTVFVLSAGSSSSDLSGPELSDCSANHILLVAALDQTRGQLTPYSNWGSIVRIASPSTNIPAIGTGGISKTYSNTTMGTSLVAARLAIFARNNKTRLGADLVRAFLEKETESLPQLMGKIPGGLALKHLGL